MEETTRTEVEAAAFRRMVEHLRERADVQNIDLMELAGFCRNCLARWYAEAAAERGVELSKEEAREIVYGMPYEEFVKRHQTERPVTGAGEGRLRRCSSLCALLAARLRPRRARERQGRAGGRARPTWCSPPTPSTPRP